MTKRKRNDKEYYEITNDTNSTASNDITYSPFVNDNNFIYLNDASSSEDDVMDAAHYDIAENWQRFKESEDYKILTIDYKINELELLFSFASHAAGITLLHQEEVERIYRDEQRRTYGDMQTQFSKCTHGSRPTKKKRKLITNSNVENKESHNIDDLETNNEIFFYLEKAYGKAFFRATKNSLDEIIKKSGNINNYLSNTRLSGDHTQILNDFIKKIAPNRNALPNKNKNNLSKKLKSLIIDEEIDEIIWSHLKKEIEKIAVAKQGRGKIFGTDVKNINIGDLKNDVLEIFFEELRKSLIETPLIIERLSSDISIEITPDNPEIFLAISRIISRLMKNQSLTLKNSNSHINNYSQKENSFQATLKIDQIENKYECQATKFATWIKLKHVGKYVEIKDNINRLKKDFSFTDQQIAGFIHNCLNGKFDGFNNLSRLVKNDIKKNILDTCTLLFAGENSRNPAIFPLNLMLLELVRNGKITFDQLFEYMPMIEKCVVKEARRVNDLYNDYMPCEFNSYGKKLPLEKSIFLILDEANILGEWLSNNQTNFSEEEILANPERFFKHILTVTKTNMRNEVVDIMDVEESSTLSDSLEITFSDTLSDEANKENIVQNLTNPNNSNILHLNNTIYKKTTNETKNSIISN